VNIDTQRADIELQRHKEDFQEDIRLLTEAAQHLRAEKVANRHQHPPEDRHRDQEAPLLPPKQTQTNPAVNMNKWINLSLDSMLTPSTTTMEPESSSATPTPMRQRRSPPSFKSGFKRKK
jgi:hypothetical protein